MGMGMRDFEGSRGMAGRWNVGMLVLGFKGEVRDFVLYLCSRGAGGLGVYS
jgi:hypothetical protein